MASRLNPTQHFDRQFSAATERTRRTARTPQCRHQALIASGRRSMTSERRFDDDQRLMSLRGSEVDVSRTSGGSYCLQLHGLPPIRRALGLRPRERRHPRFRNHDALYPGQVNRVPLLPGMRMRSLLARAGSARGQTPHCGESAPNRTRGDCEAANRPLRRSRHIQ